MSIVSKSDWDFLYSRQYNDVVWDNPKMINPTMDWLVGKGYLEKSCMTIMDYGGGTGKISDFIHRKYGHDVLLTDWSDAPLKFARENFPKLSVMQTSCPYDVKGKTFDLIVCLNVLTYLPPMVQIKFIKEFADLLNDKGKILISGLDKENEFLKKYPELTQDKTFINNLKQGIENIGLKIKDTDRYMAFNSMYEMDIAFRSFTIEKS